MLVAFLFAFFGLSFAIDLKSAVQFSIENSPYLKGLPAERLSYEGKRLSYRSSLNPSLSVEVGNFGTSKEGFSKAPVHSITYTQPLLYPSLFKKVEELYHLQSKALDYRIESEKNKLAQEAYLLFYQALYMQELLKMLEEELKLQREIKDFVEKGFKLGENTRLELLRAQRELQLLEGEKDIAYSRYKAFLEELSILTGREIKEVQGSFILPKWQEVELESLPFFTYYNVLIKSLSRKMDVERLLSKPSYSVSFTTEKVADKEYGFRLGLSVNLPIFYARQGEILELKAQERLLFAEAETQRQKVFAQLRSAKIQFEQIKKEVENIEEKLIPQAQKELELALKSYKLRTITLLELSQTKRSYYELLKRKLELTLQAHTEYAKGIAYGGSAWCGCF